MRLKNIPLWIWLQAFASILLILPIFYFQYLPLNDYPNHLASMHFILQNDAGINTYIESNLGLFNTNSLFFWIVLIFAKITGLDLAGRIALSIVLISLPWGASYFFSSLNKNMAPLGLIGALFAYNFFFSMGFANFCLSISLFLFAAGYWMKILPKKTGMREFSIMLILAFLTYSAHIISAIVLIGFAAATFLFYAFIANRAENEKKNNFALQKRKFIGFGNAANGIKEIFGKDFFLKFTPFLPAVLLILLSLLEFFEGSSSASYIIFNPLEGNLGYLFVLAPAVPSALFTMILAPYLLILYSKNKMHLPKWCLLWALFAIFFLLLSLLLPEMISSWQFIQLRFWPFFAIFLIAFLFHPIASLKNSKNIFLEIGAISFLLLLASTYLTFLQWEKLQPTLGEIDSLSSFMHEGSAVFATGEGFASLIKTQSPPSSLLHTWGYWAIEKNIYSPDLFAYKYSPIKYKDENMHAREQVSAWGEAFIEHLFSNKENDACIYWQEYYSSINWSLICDNYDFVVLREGECENNFIPAACFEKIAQKGNNIVYEKHYEK